MWIAKLSQKFSNMFKHVPNISEPSSNSCLRVLWELRRFLVLGKCQQSVVERASPHDEIPSAGWGSHSTHAVMIVFSGVQFFFHILAGGGEEKSEHPVGHTEWP